MRVLTASTLLTAALLAGCVPTPPQNAGRAPIDLKPVTVAQLNEYVADQKGKVVLIDCWSIT